MVSLIFSPIVVYYIIVTYVVVAFFFFIAYLYYFVTLINKGGVGSKNKKLVGKASGKEVLLPGEIKKDGTVEKVDKKMMAFYN